MQKNDHVNRAILFMKIIVGLRTDSFHFEGNNYYIVFFFLNNLFKHLFAIASVGEAGSCDSVAYVSIRLDLFLYYYVALLALLQSFHFPFQSTISSLFFYQ